MHDGLDDAVVGFASGIVCDDFSCDRYWSNR
jgi:hypothetical protein